MLFRLVTYLPPVHVDFGTGSAASHIVSRMMVQEDVRAIDGAKATRPRRRDVVVRDSPPLLIARADFPEALRFVAVKVCAARLIFQGDGVRLVAILNRPFLLLAAVAFVLCDDARWATVCLVGEDMAIGHARDIKGLGVAHIGS